MSLSLRVHSPRSKASRLPTALPMSGRRPPLLRQGSEPRSQAGGADRARAAVHVACSAVGAVALESYLGVWPRWRVEGRRAHAPSSCPRAQAACEECGGRASREPKASPSGHCSCEPESSVTFKAQELYRPSGSSQKDSFLLLEGTARLPLACLLGSRPRGRTSLQWLGRAPVGTLQSS